MTYETKIRPIGAENNPKTIRADDLKAIAHMANLWFKYNKLHPSQWNDPAIYQDGKLIGYMSYNGRIWAKKSWTNNKEIK